MRLSTKSRFAVNALIDLALREQAGPVALAAIAQRVTRGSARKRSATGQSIQSFGADQP